MNIRNVDLNLLLILKELIQEKNTVKVGQKLGLSQPAVSHALKRLRDVFGDPLMVRASRGLVPTRRAMELEGPINNFIKSVESLLSDSDKFDPLKSKITFRIATTDYMEQLILPGLLAVIEKEAPGCTVITRPTHGSLPKSELEEGTIDLAIAGFYGELPENFYKQNVIQDDFICVARKGHELFKGKMTLKKYASAQHVLISMDGDMKSKSQTILRKNGLEQKFTAGVSGFTSTGWIVTTTDLLLTCPRKLANSFKKHLPVETKELPFELDKISIVQVWHERHQRDGAHTWFRGIVKKVCLEL
jgi:DNA-binding transcriptional LysR family regulator